ncbi:hypothetical protein PPROV_000988200 [Pycnococcus provasolii]|uniref:Uncharacterized protein n=1 Tax=Pycnococcus provasolii TaxID=41880 RepID=A0A830HVJ1_9CHLO|nr:hypothetical protein PPROV_000988200 [Pycnococcus provasolii]
MVSARSSVSAAAAAAETPTPSSMSANELARTPPRSGPANKSATSPASRASTPGTGGSPSFGTPSSALLLSHGVRRDERTSREMTCSFPSEDDKIYLFASQQSV